VQKLVEALHGGKHLSEQKLDDAMRIMDSDRSGEVSLDEFNNWWMYKMSSSEVQAAPDHNDKFAFETTTTGSSKKPKFKFGSNNVFAGGLMNFVSADDLRCSIEHECCTNGGGKFRKDYDYVVNQRAQEEITKDPATGEVRTKDKGNGGMTLDDFTTLAKKLNAKIKKAHVAVLRLYTGSLYAPWNSALVSGSQCPVCQLIQIHY
jgi:hypothetical protein